jgi:hypothetical protein
MKVGLYAGFRFPGQFRFSFFNAACRMVPGAERQGGDRADSTAYQR